MVMSKRSSSKKKIGISSTRDFDPVGIALRTTLHRVHQVQTKLAAAQ